MGEQLRHCPLCGTANPLIAEADKERWPAVVPAERNILPRLAATILLTFVLAIGVWLLLSKFLIKGEPPSNQPSTTLPANSTPPPTEGMIYVEGGKFMMGRDDGDAYERPMHEVVVAPFYIDAREVTCEQYQKFIDATGHPPPPQWPNGRYRTEDAQLPVTGVSWEDAYSYADWAKKRLPSEAEWELAARGTDRRLYSWGNHWDPNKANVDGSAANGRLVNVGSYSDWPSPAGAFDMVGNAWEWTASPLHSYPGGSIKEDQLPRMEREKMKVIRGGCYLSKHFQATTTYRRGWPPVQGTGDYGQTGFRCALNFQH
jgi:eukaryotic-like serine/threonine-protein kinase